MCRLPNDVVYVFLSVVEMKMEAVVYEQQEDGGNLQVCAIMESTIVTLTCPVRFPVYAHINTTDHTAGTYLHASVVIDIHTSEGICP